MDGYVSIGLKNLKVLHRVATLGIATSLVWLEARDDEEIMISSMERGPDWQIFTDSALVSLYKNTCQEPPMGMTRRQIIQVLIDTLEKLPRYDIKVAELDMQCMVAESFEKDGVRPAMLFVPGSYRPILRGDGELPFLSSKVIIDDITRAKGGALPAFNAAPPVVYSTPQPAQQAPAIAPPAAPKPVSTTPGGKVSLLIWDVADRLWAEAGKPDDPKRILGIRKIAMDELEGLGVKRNTASNELGNWQKSRAPR